jgi:RNA polymerase sigma-70 factor (ECF subfamily)
MAGRNGLYREVVMQNVSRLPDVSRANGKAPVPETSDEALLESIAEGDRSAMRILFRRHNVAVYRFASRLTGDPTLAEDIVSEVFLDVWRQAATFAGISRVSTWLLAITRNKAISARRRRTNSQLDDDVALHLVDPADSPEIVVHRQDRSEILQACLTRLTPSHREIIDLVYYHDKSVDEVSQIIGAPANTVKTRMFYARRILAVMLRAAGVDGAGTP